MQQSWLNHVAIVVEEIEAELAGSESLSALPLTDFGAIEKFPSEGTQELYVGGEETMGRLLLIQPIAEGPYLRALQQRGAGLHHIAIDVPDIDQFLLGQPDTGWQLHPISFETLARNRLVWLRRSSHPLIEVQERKSQSPAKSFIDRVELRVIDHELVSSLHCRSVQPSGRHRLYTADGKELKLKTSL